MLVAEDDAGMRELITATNDLPATVAAFARTADRIRVEARMVAPGGVNLEDHWNFTGARDALEDAGYDVVVAREGTDAAALARSPDVGLLLLDVLLPRVSGDAIAEQIRHERPRLPIILMTGDYGTIFAAAAGPPILRKPFTPEQLLEAVRRALPPAKAVT